MNVPRYLLTVCYLDFNDCWVDDSWVPHSVVLVVSVFPFAFHGAHHLILQSYSNGVIALCTLNADVYKK